MNILKYDSLMHRLEERDAYWQYQEILRLDKLLTKVGIPHTLNRLFDGWQIRVRGRGRRGGSIIQHLTSYGAFKDRVEVAGFGLRDPKGYLTAEQALEYIYGGKK